MFYINIQEVSVKASNIAKAVGFATAISRYSNQEMSLLEALQEVMD